MKLQHQAHDVFPEHSTVNPAVPQAYVGTFPLSLILQATPSNLICCCHLALQSYLNSATKVLGWSLTHCKQSINNTGSSPHGVPTSTKSDPGETDAAAHLQRQNNVIKCDQVVLQTACRKASRKAGPGRTSQDGLEQ